jgi:hypothetical protein
VPRLLSGQEFAVDCTHVVVEEGPSVQPVPQLFVVGLPGQLTRPQPPAKTHDVEFPVPLLQLVVLLSALLVSQVAGLHVPVNVHWPLTDSQSLGDTLVPVVGHDAPPARPHAPVHEHTGFPLGVLWHADCVSPGVLPGGQNAGAHAPVKLHPLVSWQAV